MTDATMAWNELTTRLNRFIRRRVRDTHAADDLVQETLLRAHAQSGPVEPAWLFRVARNLIVDHYRAKGVRRTSAITDEPAQVEPPAAELSDLSGCVRAMLPRLPESDREALEQTDLGDLTQAELAAQLGLSVPGAKSRVQRARAQLRDLIASCCGVRQTPEGLVSNCECRPPDYCCCGQGKC